MVGRSKRCRLNSSLLDDFHSDAYARSLTCVRVVCQNGPDILQLPHIVDKLGGYLDNSRKWTLPKACASGSPYLVERLLASQKDEAPTSFLHRPEYRQWQFDRSLLKAVGIGNLEIVQLLVQHFGDCYISCEVVNTAASRDLTEILKWMDGWGCDIKWHTDALLGAICYEHFELAHWIEEKLPSSPMDYMYSILNEWAVVAAAIGDLDTVKQICGRLMERRADGYLRYWYGGVNVWRAVQCATDSGHLHVLQWMMDEPNRKVLLYELFGEEFDDKSPPAKIVLSCAVARGHIDVLTWLIQHFPGYCDGANADFRAAEKGYLDILRLIFSAPIEKRITPDTIDVAAGNGHLDIVKFLLTKGYPVNKAMDNAAEKGFLDIVKWLHDNISDSCSTAAMDGAASNGHLDVVKWLHDNREEGCTINAVNGAARHGHLEVVQWLHQSRKEGCTTFAMDEAAHAGNLEMVKWLHFNRSEGCTTTAMDGAARKGHLDVVKWLHSNRLEGCTTKAMNEASENNHLEVVKWLDQIRTEGFTAEAMYQAVRRGNFKVLQWLFSRRPELCVASLMNIAVVCRRFDIVWFLYHNHHECGSIESLKKALRSLHQKEFAEWAYAHHRQEFERNIAEHLFAD